MTARLRLDAASEPWRHPGDHQGEPSPPRPPAFGAFPELMGTSCARPCPLAPSPHAAGAVAPLTCPSSLAACTCLPQGDPARSPPGSRDPGERPERAARHPRPSGATAALAGLSDITRMSPLAASGPRGHALRVPRDDAEA